MISGTSVAILSSVFPSSTRGRAMGIIVGCVYLGLSLGPVLSGFMVTHLGWRWIFCLLCVAGVICSMVRLKSGVTLDEMGQTLHLDS